MTDKIVSLLIIFVFILFGIVLIIYVKVDRMDERLNDHIKNHKVDQSLTYSTLETEEGE